MKKNNGLHRKLLTRTSKRYKFKCADFSAIYIFTRNIDTVFIRIQIKRYIEISKLYNKIGSMVHIYTLPHEL